MVQGPMHNLQPYATSRACTITWAINPITQTIYFRKQNWTKATARTCPRMCALECQKVSRPSSLSNVNNLSSQSPSRGLDMSHKTPFTWEINALEAKPFDISLAISRGVVAHFFPSFTVPSSKVILDHRYIKHQPTIPKINKKHIYV